MKLQLKAPLHHKPAGVLAVAPRPAAAACRRGPSARLAPLRVAQLFQEHDIADEEEEPCDVTAKASERCFALDTMSEDGQEWVLSELSAAVVGISHKTPRATVRITNLLNYKGGMNSGRNSMRCEKLELDLIWQATHKSAEGVTFTGHAKVTMHRVGGRDTVDVAVEMDPNSRLAAPERAVADVEYAVTCLDAGIMTRLNDFLWSMETRNPLKARETSEPMWWREEYDTPPVQPVAVSFQE